MFINKKLIAGVVVALTLGATSCRKFLDVNQNPNIAHTGTMSTVLPAAQLYVGSSVGVDLQIFGSVWSGYWTQSPNASQYRILEQYNPSQDVFSTAWENLYTANENFFQVGKMADSFRNRPYKAVSLIMRAYTFQLLTDGWGDIPFSEALKGQPEDSGITSPKYDSQATVYMGTIAYIDSALHLLDSSKQATSTMRTDDLIYGGDLSLWRQFANTLKLKMLLRLGDRMPAYAAAKAADMVSNGATFIETAAQTAQIKYGASTTNRNPLYAEAAGLGYVQNLIGSSSVIDSMVANGDDRVTAFFETNSSGNYAGLLQGNYQTSAPVTNFSIPSEAVGGDATRGSNSGAAPVKFITGAEGNFLLAEATARGWISTGMTDDQYFTNGITESFSEYGLDATTYLGSGAYWTVYPTTGSLDEKIKFIITQKWFAMCGNQGFEAWTEYRRTGYPDFVPVSFSGGGASRRPFRFLYPTSESTRNVKYPGLKRLTDKVWWDVL